MKRVSNYIKAVWLDATAEAPPPRVPPRRYNFVGPGDFVDVGDMVVRQLKTHGLQPDMAVLDLGSGLGRIARPLTEYMSAEGSYTGLDIVRRGVTWCQNAYADLPNFNFRHADIYNKYYNRKGKTQASEYIFPFPDDHFDFAALMSVFTHMHTGDVAHYMSELSRVLKPGGRSVITWFLLDEINNAALAKGEASQDFAHALDDVSRTVSEKHPEGAIAFDIDWVKEAYRDNGMTLIEPIDHGYWATKRGLNYQDWIIADNA